MPLIHHPAFLRALGWALLNSVWQFGILWLVFVLLVNNSRTLSATARHGMALLLLSTGFAWFVTDLLIGGDTALNQAAQYLPVHSAEQGQKWLMYILAAIHHLVETNLAYLSAIYLVVITILLMRFVLICFHTHTLTTSGLGTISESLHARVRQLTHQADVRRKISVRISEYVDTPMVLGFIKPIILLPLASINQLTVQQLEAILIHELAHVKRNDYLINLYLAITSLLFFFNPFCRMLVRYIKTERENSCDDRVINSGFDPFQYASALLAVATCKEPASTLGVAATGNRRNLLLHRIHRILNIKQEHQRNDTSIAAYLFLAGLFSLITCYTGALTNNSGDHKRPLTGSHEKKIRLHAGNNAVTGIPAPVLAGEVRTRFPSKNYLSLQEALAYDEPLPAVATSDVDEVYAVTTTAEEPRDYSIPADVAQPLPPEAVTNVPYVPASSFSVYNTDTSKQRAQTDDGSIAKNNLFKAQHATGRLDWQKTLKQLQQNKTSITALREKIWQSMEAINRQQFDEEVTSIENKNIEALRVLLKVETEKWEHYRALQQQYLKSKSKLQQEVIEKDKAIKRPGTNIPLKAVKIIVHI